MTNSKSLKVTVGGEKLEVRLAPSGFFQLFTLDGGIAGSGALRLESPGFGSVVVGDAGPGFCDELAAEINARLHEQAYCRNDD